MKVAKFTLFFVNLIAFNLPFSIISDIGWILGYIFAPIVIVSSSWYLLNYLDGVAHRWVQKRMKCQGKSVLITGCDTGFGHEIAIKMANEGFTVFAGCLDMEHDNAQRLLHRVHEASKIHLINFNVTREEDIEKVYHAILQHKRESGEPLHSIILNAGVSGISLIECGVYEQDMKQTFEVNLFSNIKIVRKFLPELKKTSGSKVIFMSSFITKMIIPLVGGYGISKWGIQQIANTLRSEIAENPEEYNGMQVVEIEPTAHKTGMVEYDATIAVMTRTWNRSKESVKEDYNPRFFACIIFIIRTMKYFEWCDFVAMKRDFSDVVNAAFDGAVLEKPIKIYEILHPLTRFNSIFINYVLPAEIIESSHQFSIYFLHYYSYCAKFAKSCIDFFYKEGKDLM